MLCLFAHRFVFVCADLYTRFSAEIANALFCPVFAGNLPVLSLDRFEVSQTRDLYTRFSAKIVNS